MRALAAGVLAAYFLAVSPGAALGQRGPGGLSSADVLLQYPAVQAELKLTEEQVTKIKEIVQEIRVKHREDFDKVRDLGQEERREKALELMKLISQETMQRLKGVLTAEQAKRLDQIRIQEEGMRAFTDAKVQRAIKLTDEQNEKLRAVTDELARKTSSIFQTGGQGDFRDKLNKVFAVRKQAMEKAVALLNAEQKKIWKELTGEPFELKLEPRVTTPGGETKKKSKPPGY
jgi:hypothetical protein